MEFRSGQPAFKIDLHNLVSCSLNNFRRKPLSTCRHMTQLLTQLDNNFGNLNWNVVIPESSLELQQYILENLFRFWSHDQVAIENSNIRPHLIFFIFSNIKLAFEDSIQANLTLCISYRLNIFEVSFSRVLITAGTSVVDPSRHFLIFPLRVDNIWWHCGWFPFIRANLQWTRIPSCIKQKLTMTSCSKVTAAFTYLSKWKQRSSKNVPQSLHKNWSSLGNKSEKEYLIDSEYFSSSFARSTRDC